MLDDHSRQLFQNWYASDLGCCLQRLESEAIEQELDLAVGYYLLTQSPLKVLPLQNHRVRKSIMITPYLEFGAPSNTVVAKSSELPFESDGIDIHVMHHTLDISLTPHDDLREAARTLLPSGKLIIVGFNPWGLWGVRKIFSKRIKAPWCGRFIAIKRLEDWLKVAGLTLESRRFVHYEPPIQSGKWRARFQWLDKLIRPLKLPLSGVYIMTATKQEKRFIPLKPRWSAARVRVRPLTKPTAKEMKD